MIKILSNVRKHSDGQTSSPTVKPFFPDVGHLPPFPVGQQLTSKLAGQGSILLFVGEQTNFPWARENQPMPGTTSPLQVNPCRAQSLHGPGSSLGKFHFKLGRARTQEARKPRSCGAGYHFFKLDRTWAQEARKAGSNSKACGPGSNSKECRSGITSSNWVGLIHCLRPRSYCNTLIQPYGESVTRR